MLLLVLSIALLIAFAYILGSVPFGLVIAKVFYRVDIRQHGSGNIGATNCLRTLGPIAGFLVLTADVLKAMIPILIAQAVLSDSPDIVPLMSVIVGLSAVIGHSYSIFLGFSGGKGMATASGIILALWPWAAPILVGIWLLVIALTRYVSLASIIVALTLPVLVAILYPSTVYIAFSLLVGLVVVYRHRSNISRLLAGTELKMGEKSMEAD
ncbi:MAG: acyl-phosphate glycerol 3-phosphate acyltransferase [Candidatus Aquicultor secundus]|uniref:Glycerol-3-phosphate acyltransferase n=1 Tax=Candidatus Aquicultor secundus TaxID=1973895 RepID=A0A2M7T7E6_9ACTN|nr:MAG: acyl-phosphate glycerol 3-phosphate acyltransferase [Candidatus Aquicultor secundus]PIW22499.1 MAG: acyl-phosphate glycerol 3-phosphate acyltransferase [Candidatus Aquicultor secundus]PIX51639.1 MAG: acyl-phosphate glycerol 3-phosphate acyltransferase [Candidatus Aquicultor secundus]PIY40481.1 MAG: acyl-phosphate glycerol 3-phosphate acyltransferase [Candidatus Aquicultor secundus]PIZ38183.1 MAG: acyl-phosphate glycerol 3-phosphate acyltransferase [Candidatus Aquicultor secundus]